MNTAMFRPGGDAVARRNILLLFSAPPRTIYIIVVFPQMPLRLTSANPCCQGSKSSPSQWREIGRVRKTNVELLGEAEAVLSKSRRPTTDPDATREIKKSPTGPAGQRLRIDWNGARAVIRRWS